MTDWSDTPAGTIARLDESLARRGQDIVLRKVIGTANQAFVDVDVRAHVSGFRPEELIAGSGITQDFCKVIMSPTEIDRAEWPGGVPAEFIGDARVQIKGWKAVIDGRARTIEAAVPMRSRGELVRLELTVAG